MNPNRERQPKKVSCLSNREEEAGLISPPLGNLPTPGPQRMSQFIQFTATRIKPEWHLVADKVSLSHTAEGYVARSCLKYILKPGGNQMICPDNFCDNFKQLPPPVSLCISKEHAFILSRPISSCQQYPIARG